MHNSIENSKTEESRGSQDFVAIEPKYRLFISYSHGDGELVDRIEKLLTEKGLLPMRDRQFLQGVGFHEQIRRFISHAHVFVPIITKQAMKRGWVHQEIGFAMALNVPVLPIAVEQSPSEMLQSLLAVSVTTDDLSALHDAFRPERIAGLIRRTASRVPFAGEIADGQIARAQMLASHADDVLELGYEGCVRQQAAFSSFAIPTVSTDHAEWRERYGGSRPGHEVLQANLVCCLRSS